MSLNYYKELYTKFKSNTLSEIEKNEWEGFVSDSKNEFLLQQLLDYDWEELLDEQSWVRLSFDRENHIFEHLLWITQKRTKGASYYTYQVFGAAAVVLIVLFSYLFLYESDPVLPGRNLAYILLPDGRKIELNQIHSGIQVKDGKLNYTDGQLLKAGLDIDTMKISLVTPKGGQYQLVLSDGTKVWLNADSRISYPVSFASDSTRNVNVDGEAYFDVKHDADKPFIVHAGKQHVRVLGTQFSVTAYKDYPVAKTTLLSGKIALSSGALSVVLKPDQQALLINGNIIVQKVRAMDELAWTKGEFVLDEESLESIMIKLSRWYNLSVSYEEEDIKNEKFEGVLSRFDEIDDTLELLRSIGNVEFKRNGRKIEISYKNKKRR